jgi:transposase
MTFAGLDIHKRVVEAAVLDDRGQLIHRERFECDREQLVSFARRRLRDARVAVEATTNTWAVVDVLQPHVREIVVSNPLRTRAIAEAKVKTDKVDALVLAQLLRADFLPSVWQPDDTTRERRRLTAARAALVADRTRHKNRIHAVLAQRLIRPPVDELFGKRGRAFLASLELDERGRGQLDAELRLLAAVENELADADTQLAKDGYADPRIHLLVTLPGVDVAVAQTLIAALGDVRRFRDADHAASYLGIVPSTKQSAEHCYHGPITKQGRGHARWMLVQAAQHVGRHPGPLGVFFRRLAKRKNRNVAVVATARKLVTIAYHMLKNNEPYRYAQPMPTQQKLQRMRTRATGERRKTGPRKGLPRHENYGKGGTRKLPALADLYACEGLPATRPLQPGEQRMVQERGVERFVRDLEVEMRVPRRKASNTDKEATRGRKDHGDG